ncbi:hypothetical protein GGI08_005201 [Coemansia sp. S2]|nr:hypothetical protein GGI08_005201 [Coemansia sp. S2]KAJ2345866.1 hypothetical protein GGH92_003867 [Coemansia sp. RSA 2673]
MGSSGHALRNSAASSSSRQQRSSARSHPYSAVSKSQPQHTHRASRINETALSSLATAVVVRPTTTPAMLSTVINSELGVSPIADSTIGSILSDDWSPFSSLPVQQYISSGSSVPSSSLLGHMERTPMYSPRHHPTYYAPVARPNNPPVLTTYAGYKYPFEHITVRVLDIDSGEFLSQFHQR